jgi:hypothetical protein
MRMLVIGIRRKLILIVQVKDSEVGETCSSHEESVKCLQILVVNQKAREHFRDVSLDLVIILNRTMPCGRGTCTL